MKPSCNVATLIERFFTERLMRQRNVSGNTIASYRDTFRLLFKFAQARLRKPPSSLALDDLDAPFIGAFLNDLETERGAGVRTRNLRLTAIRSFFRFVSFEEPVRDRAIAISSMSSFPMTKSTPSGGAAMMLPRALSRRAGYVDGPLLARLFGQCSDQIACVHMFGLFSRSHMNAGQDGFRDASSKHPSDLWRPVESTECLASWIDRSHHLLVALQVLASAQHGCS